MQSWLLARTCEESGMPDAVATALGLSYASGFEVEFVGTDGVERRGPFLRCWDEPFEVALPIRSFPSFKGQKNFTGLYWAATSRSQVGYESWVERDAAMALDFDPAVVGLASQPFRLCWPQRDRQRTHTPDYFARLVNGTGVVIDVRPDDVVDEAAAEVFAVAAQVCAAVGWQFRQVGALDKTYAANLRWLARYRTAAATRRRWPAFYGRSSPIRCPCLLAQCGPVTVWQFFLCSIT
jgi:hypothetical protein